MRIHTPQNVRKVTQCTQVWSLKLTYFNVNRNEMEKYESEYTANGEGCFIFEVQKPGGGWVCIDATRAYRTIGLLVNHSPNPNVKGRVAVVEGKLRMGFLAMKDLEGRRGPRRLWTTKKPTLIHEEDRGLGTYSTCNKSHNLVSFNSLPVNEKCLQCTILLLLLLEQEA